MGEAYPLLKVAAFLRTWNRSHKTSPLFGYSGARKDRATVSQIGGDTVSDDDGWWRAAVAPIAESIPFFHSQAKGTKVLHDIFESPVQAGGKGGRVVPSDIAFALYDSHGALRLQPAA